MRIPRASSTSLGLTVLEVMVVLFTVTVLVALVLSSWSHGFAPDRTYCINNQRQCALGFILFTADNNNHYPWDLAETNPAYLPGSTKGDAAADFNEIIDYVKVPSLFVCPTDPAKIIHPDLSPIKNLNLSYGTGYDTGSNASANILTLDRHLIADSNPVLPGLFTYSTNQTMGWSSELHRSNAPRGVMSFYDGHAEIVSGANINAAFQREGLARARFAVP